MSAAITAGAWRASPLRRSSANSPCDWVAEITAIDPATRRHHYVGRLVQAGSRSPAEARANLAATTLIPDMIRVTEAVARVLAMSDPDSDTFADSAGDCLEALLALGPDMQCIRALLCRHSAIPSSVASG